MAKHKKSIMSSNWIKWGVLPVLLLGFWAVMSFLYFQDAFGITSLTNNYGVNNFTKFSEEELHQGDVVEAEFKAKYDHLGIVLVRFNTFYKINNDFVLFRIKEKGKADWMYENRYKVDQFQPNELFTFGFPVIPDSGGKTYVYQVESVQGIEDDAVAVSDIEPIFVAKYQYPRSEISASPQQALQFLSLKVINSFTNIEFLTTSLIYLLPLLLYVLYQLFFTKYLSDKYYLVLIPLTILLVESIFVNNTNDLLVIILTLMIAVTVYVYKLESSVTFAFVLFSCFLLRYF